MAEAIWLRRTDGAMFYVLCDSEAARNLRAAGAEEVSAAGEPVTPPVPAGAEAEEVSAPPTAPLSPPAGKGRRK